MENSDFGFVDAAVSLSIIVILFLLASALCRAELALY